MSESDAIRNAVPGSQAFLDRIRDELYKVALTTTDPATRDQILELIVRSGIKGEGEGQDRIPALSSPVEDAEVKASLTDLELVREVDYKLIETASAIFLRATSEPLPFSFRLEIPQLGYAREFSTADLNGFLAREPEAIERMVMNYIAQVEAYENDEVFETDSGDLAFPLPPDPLPFEKVIVGGLRSILKQEGLIKGPCPRCGRSNWYTAYRPQGRSGRPPLESTYCPDCAVEIRRARWTGSKRRQRAKEQGGGEHNS